MDSIKFYTPDEYIIALANLKKVPFAKTEEGYRFAEWVYDLDNDEDSREKLRECDHGKEAVTFFDTAKKALEKIVVTEKEYLNWTVHKKESGGVKQYHDIIRELGMRLLMLTIDETADDILKEEHLGAETLYTMNHNESENKTKCVLNRHNPFADVTIKSQQFYYKTASGGTETLFFNTNNIVEKKDKNGTDMLTMRPGFTVSKEHGVVQKPMRKVTFSNSITEPIVGDEEHIYVHID